jgi:hypothetical protein
MVSLLRTSFTLLATPAESRNAWALKACLFSGFTLLEPEIAAMTPPSLRKS